MFDVGNEPAALLIGRRGRWLHLTAETLEVPHRPQRVGVVGTQLLLKPPKRSLEELLRLLV